MSDHRFMLDPKLTADTHPVVRWRFSDVLLMNDARFPWLILVPRVPDVTELFQLAGPQRAGVVHEAMVLGETLQGLFSAEKINTAILGNVVPQLHIHVIARFSSDSAWPGPVWGVGAAQPYSQGALRQRLEQLLSGLPNL